jgi:acetyl esterase/lipase
VIGAGGYDRPLRELALATGFVVAAPPMRLAPEHRYPAAFEDSLLAARWLAGAKADIADWLSAHLESSPETP